MAEGKWITGLSTETPVVDAARRVLGARLEVIRQYLPLAAKAPEEDVEYVHQLRVATRRTGSALKIFATCLPGKRAKAARKLVRQIRRAAGEARDWDVFQDMLADRARDRPSEESPGLDFLRGLAFAQRLAAQPNLVAVADAGIDTVGIVAALGEPADYHAPRRLGDLALPLIKDRIADLDREIAIESEDHDHLHQVRILGKRLRYAMEVFADCFDPPFRQELYPAIEAMQEILGDANDSHVATQRLAALRHQLKMNRPADWLRYQAGLEHLLQWHRRRLPEARQQFADWLTRWQPLRASLNQLARPIRLAPPPEKE